MPSCKSAGEDCALAFRSLIAHEKIVSQSVYPTADTAEPLTEVSVRSCQVRKKIKATHYFYKVIIFLYNLKLSSYFVLIFLMLFCEALFISSVAAMHLSGNWSIIIIIINHRLRQGYGDRFQ